MCFSPIGTGIQCESSQFRLQNLLCTFFSWRFQGDMQHHRLSRAGPPLKQGTCICSHLHEECGQLFCGEHTAKGVFSPHHPFQILHLAVNFRSRERRQTKIKYLKASCSKSSRTDPLGGWQFSLAGINH